MPSYTRVNGSTLHVVGMGVNRIGMPLGRTQKPGGTTILPRPSGFALGMAMTTMGFEQTQALGYARGSGRSLAALARLIPSGSIENPAWVSETLHLLPAILAGAWDSANPLDCAIIEQIAGGTSYTQIESHVRAMSTQADPPFDLVGSLWKIRAPMDAFIRVGRFIGARDAASLREAMITVFGQLTAESGPTARADFLTPKSPTRKFTRDCRAYGA